MKLSEAKSGETVAVKGLCLGEEERTRLRALGFAENRTAIKERTAAGGTCIVRIGATLIAVGREIADGIFVERVGGKSGGNR